MNHIEIDQAKWWGRSAQREEERLKREFKEMEEEYRLLSRLLQFTDGRTSVFKYLKRRHAKIGEQLWAIRNVDLTAQPECRP